MNIDRLAWIIVGVVVVTWFATTVVLPFVVSNYVAPASVGVTMGSLAGGAAAYLFARRQDKNGDGNGRGTRKEKRPSPPRK